MSANLTVSVRVNAKPALKAIASLELELDRLVQRLRQLLLDRPDLLVEIVAVDTERRPAARAGERRVTAQPTNRLLSLVLALRALNRDLGRVQVRRQQQHQR